MNTQELAKTFTDMCAKGEFDAAGKRFWSDDIVSREPMTGDMAVLKGRKAVEGKGQWWYANHEVHNAKVRAETNTPKRPPQFYGKIAETKCVHESPPVRGYSH
jgi:hypothetical protein